MKRTHTWKSALSVALAAMIALSSSMLMARAQNAILSEDALANAEYPIGLAPAGKAQLKDGKFEDLATEVNVQLIEPGASGNANRDGMRDAAVTLAVNTGGTGHFVYVAVVLNENGVARPVDSVILGDRIKVRNIVFGRNNELVVNLLERRYDQAMADPPTIRVTRRFRLNADNKLIAVSALSSADLNYANYPLEGVKGGSAFFEGGKFEDKAAEIYAQILKPPLAPVGTGDVDGDGSPDSAVTLFVNTGGTAQFVFVCVVLNQSYIAVPVQCEVIDDRIRVTGVAMKDGQITVSYLGRRDGQPMAARPTVRMTKKFALKANAPEAEAQAPVPPVKGTNINRVDYVCADGAPMSVIFGEGTANVTYGANIIEDLKQDVSASGFRYANERVELIGKGDEAQLGDIKSGMAIYKDCKAQPKPAVEAAPALVALSGKLTGTVSYLQRIALAPDALVAVQLQDISRADSPAVLVASEEIKIEGKSVPIPFELTYDPAKIEPEALYSLSARIFEGGKLRWINTRAVFVLTRGNPAQAVDVQVDLVGSGSVPQPPTEPEPILDVAYVCDNSVKLTVQFDNTAKTAKVTTAGDKSETRTLTQQESGSGIRYADDTWELRSAGPGLVIVKPGTGEIIFGNCMEQPAQQPQPPVQAGENTPNLSGVLTGSVTYLQRIALQPGAVVEVKLEDVSLADAPAKLITSQIIQAAGRQVPIPFELKYDPKAIDPRMTYALRVSITLNGKLIWINGTRYAALTRGAPATDIEVVVDPVQ